MIQSDHCGLCLLPSGVVPIADEVCSLCANDNHKVKYKGEAELIKLLDHHKKTARRSEKKFDCLVPLSGGKDSTYALYRLVTKYEMRVLAFNYEHSFTNKQAKLNVEKAVKKLGVNLIRNTDDREQMRYLKHNLLTISSLPAENIGCLSPLLCVGCNQGYAKKANEVAKKWYFSYHAGRKSS